MQPDAYHRQHRARRGDRRERADRACSRRASSPAPASTSSSTSRRSIRSSLELARKGKVVLLPHMGSATHRRPHRHGREGDHQHQDLRRRPQAAGPGAADDVLSARHTSAESRERIPLIALRCGLTVERPTVFARPNIMARPANGPGGPQEPTLSDKNKRKPRNDCQHHETLCAGRGDRRLGIAGGCSPAGGPPVRDP